MSTPVSGPSILNMVQYSLVENEITDEGAIAFAEYLSITTTLTEMR